MRDEAPVAKYAHLVPESKVVEVGVSCASASSKHVFSDDPDFDDTYGPGPPRYTINNSLLPPGSPWSEKLESEQMAEDVAAEQKEDNILTSYRPFFVFKNDTHGPVEARSFARQHLLSLLHPDYDRLAGMVRAVPGFPQKNITFQHVLDIAQQKGGLELAAKLLLQQTGLAFDPSTAQEPRCDAVAACEAGGWVFAAAVAKRLGLHGVPLLLARTGGKLPPPTFRVEREQSHISRDGSEGGEKKVLEMTSAHGLSKEANIVIVDDVVASGWTLIAMIQLLIMAGFEMERIRVVVVAEFPVHKGRWRLMERGFRRVDVRSLLIFGGA